jgi:hypothetical protein
MLLRLVGFSVLAAAAALDVRLAVGIAQLHPVVDAEEA